MKITLLSCDKSRGSDSMLQLKACKALVCFFKDCNSKIYIPGDKREYENLRRMFYDLGKNKIILIFKEN